MTRRESSAFSFALGERKLRCRRGPTQRTTIPRIVVFDSSIPVRAKRKTTPFGVVSLFGDPYGNRTHVTAVKGRCLNRLTNGPGSGNLIRTDDIPGMNRLLYQLSYTAMFGQYKSANCGSASLLYPSAGVLSREIFWKTRYFLPEFIFYCKKP